MVIIKTKKFKKKAKNSQIVTETKPTTLNVVLFSNYEYPNPRFDNQLKNSFENQRRAKIELVVFHGYLNGNCEDFYRATSNAQLLLSNSENIDWHSETHSLLQAQEELLTIIQEAKNRNPRLLVMALRDDSAPIRKISQTIRSWEDPLVIEAIQNI